MKPDYVLYKEFGTYKLTDYDNYLSIVRNENDVLDLSNFNDVKSIIAYLAKYTKIDTNKIIDFSEV